MAAVAAAVSLSLRSPSRGHLGLQLPTPTHSSEDKFDDSSRNRTVTTKTPRSAGNTDAPSDPELDPETLLRGAAQGTSNKCVETPEMRSRRRSHSCHETLGQLYFPRLNTLVRSRLFEASIGSVIVINCFTMGLEAELVLGNAAGCETFVTIAEHVITAVFLVEFVLRLIVYGWRSFLPVSGQIWNFVDALLVLLTGVLTVWILPALGAPSGSTFQTLTVLRALRLARLVRVVQSVEAFHEVWLLLRGLMESGRVLFWTVIVIFLITYIFAVFGVVLLGTKIKEEHEDVLNDTGVAGQELEFLVSVTDGVLPMMYTLIQVLTLDSWNSIARPMVKHVAWSWSFFYLYISIAVIVMMNLVTAVIVENALKNSQQDAADLLLQKEKEREAKLAHFQRVFEELDDDGNGELSWQEFESAFEDPLLAKELLLLGIDSENCREIFDLLDDGDGVLTPKVFFQGLSRMDGTAHAKDLLRTSKMTDMVLKLVRQQGIELQEDVGELLRHTPGALVRERTGSLRSRACRPQRDETCVSRTISNAAICPPAAVSTDKQSIAPNQPQGATGELGLVLRRLDEVAGMVHDTRQELKHFKDKVAMCAKGVETCNQRLSLVDDDLYEFRTGKPRASTSDPQEGFACDSEVLSGIQNVPQSQWRNQLATKRLRLAADEALPLASP